MVVRRYAAGTTVSTEQSRRELERLLRARGCERMAWASGPEGDMLQFVIGGRQHRFLIEKPTQQTLWAQMVADGRRQRVNSWPTHIEAEWRRRWRAHVLLLKAKLEFTEGDDDALEREFLPYLLLPNNQTVEEWVVPELDAARERGEVPAFPLLGDGKP